MADKKANKVVFGAMAIMDISDSTVTPETLAEGATAYDKTGEKITGTMKSGGGGFEPSALLDHGYGNATFIPASDWTIPAGGKYGVAGADNELPTTHTGAVGYIYGHPEITAQQKRNTKWSYLGNVWNCSTTDFTFKAGEAYTFVYLNNPN